jgi:hypothetical protein
MIKVLKLNYVRKYVPVFTYAHEQLYIILPNSRTIPIDNTNLKV